MEFALTQEVSSLILENGVSDMITGLSDELEVFLKDKSYGGVETMYIGIICVAPEFDFFLKLESQNITGVNK